MKTNKLALHTDWIRTESSNISWYENSQMGWHEEIKDGIPHGNSKVWWRDGQLRWHEVYEGGIL